MKAAIGLIVKTAHKCFVDLDESSFLATQAFIVELYRSCIYLQGLKNSLTF